MGQRISAHVVFDHLLDIRYNYTLTIFYSIPTYAGVRIHWRIHSAEEIQAAIEAKSNPSPPAHPTTSTQQGTDDEFRCFECGFDAENEQNYIAHITPKCPQGFYGTYPNCHEPCPPYHIGYQPDCVRMKCLPGYKGDYQPDCVKVNCPDGEIGLYPNCVAPTTTRYLEVKECPAGQIGAPPNCRAKCPQYTYGEPPNCKQMKCPNGWEGDYQPNCHLKPKCPQDTFGVWPNCVSQYCPPGSTGTYPDCKCRPGTVGTPPNCKEAIASNTGYLPPYVPSGYLPPNGHHQSAKSDFHNFGLLPPNV